MDLLVITLKQGLRSPPGPVRRVNCATQDLTRPNQSAIEPLRMVTLGARRVTLQIVVVAP